MHRAHVLAKLPTGPLVTAHDQDSTVGLVHIDWIEVCVRFDFLQDFRYDFPFWLLFQNGLEGGR